MGEILEVDLLRFEHGDAAARRAVVDGVRRSLETGFVYTSHDLPEDVIDEASPPDALDDPLPVAVVLLARDLPARRRHRGGRQARRSAVRDQPHRRHLTSR